MKVIIYESNTGSAKRYAEMLGEKTGFPVCALSEADGIDKTAGIIFIGWVMAGTVSGLKDARLNFENIEAVCAVGILKSEKSEKDLIEQNEITEPFFYLQGAFYMSKLSGMHKMLMGLAVRAMKHQIKDVTDPDAKKAVDMIENGVDFVDEKNLDPIMEMLSDL